MDWHYGNILETVADTVPEAPALLHGDTVITWRQFDAAADALAVDLVEAGLHEQSKVGIYLHNDPAYLVAMYAAFKAGLAPFNVNYRYAAEEVHYLLDNADAEAVVFHASFAPLLEEVRDRLALVKRWYVVADGAPAPAWATPYEHAVGRPAERFTPEWGRRPDHVLLMYTGGTTGMPKGVMWTHDDLFASLGRGGNPVLGVPEAQTYDDIAERVDVGQVLLAACPLMHGTGQFTAFVGLAGGAAICTIPNRSFDPAELLRTIDQHRVTSLIIVGDAFARPILGELRANRDAYDLSSLFLVISSGVMWSHEVKQGLLEQLPSVILYDSYGSSEAVGLGVNVSTAESTGETARFQLGERVKVFTEDGRPVEPGSDETGFVAIGGPQPLGYYKDPEKTAATFRTIDGVRYSVPGDYAQVNADGSLHLLGRGSVCINTGGEKVFPEEVEEVLKAHPSVTDAVCVGLPDERFGETICAVVEPADGAVDHEELIEHVRGRLARYKSPRDIVLVDTIGRAPNGKVDYKRLREHARAELGR
jgi:acyl-CoA synthetase (AMP-forming)/AMP-acid ligase II